MNSDMSHENERKLTVFEASRIVNRDPQGPKVVEVICELHDEPVASVQEDPTFGFVLRTGGERTVMAFVGDNPTMRYVYVCPQRGDLRPDPALLAQRLEAYRLTTERQKLILNAPG